jgi:hypothetical protein
MTAPPRTAPIKLFLTTALALTAAVTMGTAATVFVASDVASRAAAPTTTAGRLRRGDPSQRAMGRDPASSTLQAIAANRSLSAVSRYSAIRDALFGGCQNTREVLFGATPARRQMVQAMVASIADLPRAALIAPLTMRALDVFSAGVAPDAGPGHRAEAAWSRRLVWLVPERVRNRREFCERY